MDQRADAATPMIAQYLEIRAANPDCLLFYRMGDFYELFFGDAETASRTLGIALTKRGRHRGEDIPMCGVPVVSADDYLQKLIAAGHRVAVCEQTEDPKEAKKRGAKSVVRRDVVRLVTAGTITEERLLEAGRPSFLMAVARSGGAGQRVYGLSWADISTGEFRLAEIEGPLLSAEIARIEPREILLSDELHDDPELRPVWHLSGAVMAPLPRASFDGAEAERRIARFFGVETVDGFGAFSRCELTAAAALLGYVERTQFADRPPLSPPSREAGGASMVIDPATRANLELVRTLSGESRGSLLAAIDRTVTPPGFRLLAQRLASPLTEPAEIAARLDAVEAVLDDAALRVDVRTRLKSAPDMARALSRIAMGRASPRDLGAIRAGLSVAIDLKRRIAGIEALAQAASGLGRTDLALHARLADTLVDDLPPGAADGGFVRAGYDVSLDEARSLRDESRRVIARLQARYAEETGIKALKVRHNAVLGYFVEVGANHAERLLAEPLKQTFFHRQTMAGAMRFSSVELGDLERRLTSAADQALGLEHGIFAALSTEIASAGEGIKAAAEALAVLDVTASLAELAAERGYVRPVVDSSLAFEIVGGRHPVVEQMLDDVAFVANDCDLSPLPGETGPGRIRLITGPNMAGKSTYLRQNALLAILAQMGAFVPASSARIGVVDRLFSRVGAADDLARGRSTFMVEMVETAAILNQAGQRALVILDEIGRGTATFDGLSIAWGTIEHLHEVNCCRALFATHYHELTALAQRLARLSNATIRVKEWEGEVVFLHEVVAGAADRSYGVQVAKLAGLPASVIARAREVLSALEAEERKGKPVALIDDLPLFRAAAAPPAKADPALAALDEIRPDDLSPREALEALYKLKGLRGRS